MVLDDQVSFKTARADPDECHAIAVAPVHVGLQFKDVAAKWGGDGVDFNFGSVKPISEAAMWARCEMDEGVEEGLHSKVGEG